MPSFPLLPFFFSIFVLLVDSQVIGTNLGSLSYWSSQHIFADVAMRGFTHWYFSESSTPNPDDSTPYSRSWNDFVDLATISTDANGYPVEVPIRNALSLTGVPLNPLRPFNCPILHDNDLHPSGEYTLVLQGTGQIRFLLTGTDATFGDAPFASPGTYTFFIPHDGSVCYDILFSDVSDPISKIEIYLPLHTPGVDLFNRDFIQLYQDYEVFRYMDLQKTNDQDEGPPYLDLSWSSRTLPEHFTQSAETGVAIEHLIDLANEVDVYPWFCVPMLADETWLNGFADLVAERLNSHLKVYLELSNEVWNSIFPSSHFCWQVSAEECNVVYAQRQAQVCQTVSDAIGRDRVICILAGQAANTWWVRQRLENFKVDPVGSVVGVDMISLAPYFGGSVADDMCTADVNVVLNQPNAVLDELELAIAVAADWMSANHELAIENNLTMSAYEGGQHLVANIGTYRNDDEVTEALSSINRMARIGELYVQYLDHWYGFFGNAPQSSPEPEQQLFLHFSNCGGYGRSGSWGAIEMMYENGVLLSVSDLRSRYPKFAALRDRIAAVAQPRCFGLRQWHPNVCEGNGRCVAHDDCDCSGPYVGVHCTSRWETIGSVAGSLSLLSVGLLIVGILVVVILACRCGGEKPTAAAPEVLEDSRASL